MNPIQYPYMSGFMQSDTAKSVIENRLNKPTVYNTNSAGVFRNPIFDLRTQQELAGELDPTAFYPNPLLPTTPTSEESTPDDEYACPIGETYDPVLARCVPMETNSGSSGDTTDTTNFYQGNTFLPMANDPVNTELRRFAGQKNYQPTLGDSLSSLGKFLYQNSIFGQLFPGSYTQPVAPRPEFAGGSGYNIFDPEPVYNPLDPEPDQIPNLYNNNNNNNNNNNSGGGGGGGYSGGGTVISGNKGGYGGTGGEGTSAIGGSGMLGGGV